MVISKTIIVKNPMGLNMRAASNLIQIISKFQSQVVFHKGETQVNGRSLLGLLSLAAGEGTWLKIVAEGDDADSLIEALFSSFDSGFEKPIPPFFKTLVF